MTSETNFPDKRKLELLLSELQRKDKWKIFAEPVNGDEVEGYYDTIKEPMDFGTISRNLNEGSYRTLHEFQRDVYLVSSNAMAFNPSRTIFYRQAKAIRDLSDKLFEALKEDSDIFGKDPPFTSSRGSKTKTVKEILSCGSLNQSTERIASKVYKDKVVEDRRETYSSWDSLSNENESIMSSVCKNSIDVYPELLAKLNDMGYKQSLMQFVEDLGPSVQKLAHQNLQWCTDGSISTWRATLNSENFKGKMDILHDNSLAKMTSTLGILNSNDYFSQGLVQASNKMENIGYFDGQLVEGARSVSFQKDVADQGIGSSPYFPTGLLGGNPNFTTTWNACNNSNNLISSANIKGNNFFQTIGETGNHLSTFRRGDGIPFSPKLNTEDNLTLSINMGKNVQVVENPFDYQWEVIQALRKGSSAFVEYLANQGQIPADLLGTRNTNFSSSQNMQIQGTSDKFISSDVNLIEYPGSFLGKSFQMSDSVATMNNNLASQGMEGYFSTPSLVGENSNYLTLWNTHNNPNNSVSSEYSSGSLGKLFQMEDTSIVSKDNMASQGSTPSVVGLLNPWLPRRM